jgi:hypothetical protein
MLIMSFNVLEYIERMCVTDAGTKLNIGLMQEIGTGVLYIKEQIGSLNAIKRYTLVRLFLRF